jgi:hypothetical protein
MTSSISRTKRVLTAFLLLTIASASTAAFAFPFGYAWMMPSDSNNPKGTHNALGRAGGGGLWSTGSRHDKGLDCQSCHIKATADRNKVIGVTLSAQPDWTDPSDPTKTIYQPGQTYTVTLSLTNEQKLPGNGVPDTLNGFAATFESEATQQRAGVLRSDIAGVDSNACPQTFPQPVPPSGTSYVYGNCNAIVFIPRVNTVSWTFGWTAPAQGSGPVRLYYSVVDGDHPDKSSLDDIVNTNSILIAEQ